MAQRDEIREIQQELRKLRQRVSARPIIVKEGGGASGSTLIRIRRGNKIAEYSSGPAIKVYGMKYVATSISAILAAEIDGTGPETGSSMDDAYQDGLCWGTIVDSGVDVFIANKATPYGGSAETDVTTPYCLPENSYVYCLRSVTVQKTADPTTLLPVWLTWRV